MEPESGDLVWSRAAVGREKKKDDVGHGTRWPGSTPDGGGVPADRGGHGIVDCDVVRWRLHGVGGHDSMKCRVQELI